MIFSNQATPPCAARTAGAAGRAAVFLAALALLAACGGGSTQYDEFQPRRLLVFGDDDSALTQRGRNYSVNGLDANGAIDCTASPIWVQQVASIYGFTFAECNPTFVGEPAARMLAFAGAKVSDVTAQVEAQVASGGFRDKDLATLLAGTNDMLELYAQFPSRDENSLLADARARGVRLAQVVNRLVGLGVKVVVSDLPDVGLTPYAAEQNRLAGTAAPAALLSRLTTAFNEQLGVNVVLDGRFVGLVQSQLRFQAIARSPGSFGLTDISTAVCTTPLPDCTDATLITGGVSTSSLWADATRLAPGGHAQLAQLAVDRARRNPF